MPGARLVVLGKQGAGKGTQCVRLSRHYVVPHISTGDMLRNAVRSRTEAGLAAKGYMDAGELIPDSVVIGLVDERLAHHDTNRGFILDGFPRTVAQASALASLLAPRALDAVIDLEVETEVVLARLASRRVCSDCAANYSTSQPPKVAWICDICGGEVIQRADDTEAAIRRRLELYERETSPLVAWYAAQGIMAAVDGEGPPDEVSARLVKVVDDWRQRALVEARPRGVGGGFASGVDGGAGIEEGSVAASDGGTSGATARATVADGKAGFPDGKATVPDGKAGFPGAGGDAAGAPPRMDPTTATVGAAAPKTRTAGA